jgi:hypothetical protein
MAMGMAMSVAETVTGSGAPAGTAAAVAISAAEGIVVMKPSAGDLEAADIAVCFTAVVRVV